VGGAENIPQSSELAPGPGFRIRAKFDRPPLDHVERFRHVDLALVSDLMNRLYTLRSGLKPIVPTPDGTTLIGPACTVKLYPGDNLMVHAALDFAEPGDVIVVDTAGSMTNAAIGDMVTAKAKSRGIAGFVVDGLVRDVEAMLEVGLPVFARGATPRGPLHRGPGELNYPVSCGGVSIEPGDLVLAGLDGVVIVPRVAAGELIDRAEKKMTSELEYVSAVRRGEFSNQWVDDMLKASGCVFE
jgi:RraA family protein